MDKRFTAGLGLLVLLTFASSCGQSGSTPSTTGPTLALGLSSCPRTAPANEPLPPRPGLADELVPAGPVRASVCRYEGLNGPASAGSLVRSHVVSGAALDDLVALFDSSTWQVITQPPYLYCPMDDGASDVVQFRYASGPSVDVRIDLGGCGFASNGVRTVGGYGLGRRLASLVGSPSR